MKIRDNSRFLFFMFCTTIFAGRDYINEMEQNDLANQTEPNTEGLLSDMICIQQDYKELQKLYLP